MLEKIKRNLSILKAKWRIIHGFCPLCNSDAPELYDCPCCNYYHSSKGPDYPFPPTKETKAEWLDTQMQAINALAMIRGLVLESKEKRKKQSGE